MDKFYTELVSILDRSFGKDWYLDGSTLIHFMRNYTLKGCKDIYIAHHGNMELFLSMACRRGLTREGDTFKTSMGNKWILRETPIVRTYEEFAKDYDRVRLHFPANIGTECDKYDINWTETPRAEPFVYPINKFFSDPERRENGHKLIWNLLECGKRSGIADKMFLGFGSVLGYALNSDFLPGDDDIDMCILADDIPQEQRHQYLVECKNMKLTENRLHGPVSIGDKYCWVSLGDKSPYTEHGVKACNWFWFKHGGIWWHSKGSMWTGHRLLHREHPTAKGIPDTMFDGKLKTVSFGGVQVQVPERVGACLDCWYPGFVTRKSESSAIKNLLVMPTDNPKSWYIERK